MFSNMGWPTDLPVQTRLARDKWEYLKERGYVLERVGDKGFSFRKGEVRGFIDVWGRVTWESVDE